MWVEAQVRHGKGKFATDKACRLAQLRERRVIHVAIRRAHRLDGCVEIRGHLERRNKLWPHRRIVSERENCCHQRTGFIFQIFSTLSARERRSDSDPFGRLDLQQSTLHISGPERRETIPDPVAVQQRCGRHSVRSDRPRAGATYIDEAFGKCLGLVQRRTTGHHDG